MTKKIEIKEDNREKINNAIREVEGKARERCYDYDIIKMDLETVEKHLFHNLQLTKKVCDTLVVLLHHWEQRFAKSYKYKAYDTRIFVTFNNGKWFFQKAERTECTPEPSNFTLVGMSTEMRDKILDNVMKGRIY